ncbi:MAG: oxidoreductase [Bacteroidetes bacterium]|nr:oxidoreductase [Bacteroidota bacterium]
MKKVALITGASSGIGESAAILLQNAGFKVYGAARRVEKMKDLESKGISTIALDITKDVSVENCVNTILEKEGRIDVLVNNAGYGSYGAVEDVPMEEARRQFDVNIFGLARLTQLVLPKMREHQFGKIVNISSMGGKVYTPFGAWYHATKHALEGWSDSLRLEVKPFGIDVVVVEPGGIKTPWGIIAAENLKKTSGNGAYAEQANKTAEGTIKMYSSNQLTKPEAIGKVILKAVTARKPKRRYVKGFGAKPALFIRKWFGDAVYEKAIQSMA